MIIHNVILIPSSNIVNTKRNKPSSFASNRLLFSEVGRYLLNACSYDNSISGMLDGSPSQCDRHANSVVMYSFNTNKNFG